jgi:hypothetical protein
MKIHTLMSKLYISLCVFWARVTNPHTLFTFISAKKREGIRLSIPSTKAESSGSKVPVEKSLNRHSDFDRISSSDNDDESSFLYIYTG